MEFRFESFNFANHPNWNFPSTSITSLQLRRGDQRPHDAHEPVRLEVHILTCTILPVKTTWGARKGAPCFYAEVWPTLGLDIPRPNHHP